MVLRLLNDLFIRVVQRLQNKTMSKHNCVFHGRIVDISQHLFDFGKVVDFKRLYQIVMLEVDEVFGSLLEPLA